jgi:hypothetical protein
LSLNGSAMVVYPYLSNEKGLCMDTNEIRTSLVIRPGESIVVPIKCSFTYTENDSKEFDRYISFDLKTSLYKDPTNYVIKFVAKKDDTVEDKVFRTHKVTLLDRIINPIKYRIING